MPKREYDFFTYILASRSRQLYVGVTNSLERRMKEHLAASPESHVGRYRIHRLVYFEHTQYVLNAIAREKELKQWSHRQKLELISRTNLTWDDLSVDWGHSLRSFWRREAAEGRGPLAKAKADPLQDDKQRGAGNAGSLDGVSCRAGCRAGGGLWPGHVCRRAPR